MSSIQDIKQIICKRSVGYDMDKENQTITIFSDILFTDPSNDSIGLKFAMKPCSERKRVRKLIESGGGFMLSKHFDNSYVNLVTLDADINEYNNSFHNLYYMSYVFDCCKANELLDLEKYRLKKTTTITRSNDSEDETNNETIETTQRFTDCESYELDTDLQILQYIGRRVAFADIGGNRLWTKLVDDIVGLNRTWESTKHRFFTYIMPNIDNYSIDDSYKQSFTKYYKSIAENNSKDAQKWNIYSNFTNSSVPKAVITESNEDIEESNEVNDSNGVSQVIGRNQSSQTKIKPKVNESNETHKNKSICNENLAKTSKYFNHKSCRNIKTNEKEKSFIDSYFDFLQRRDEISTPENHHRIKLALKMSTKGTNNELLNKNSIKDNQKTTFGAKILQKVNEKQPKIDRELDTEIGQQVSDISSDESIEIEDQSVEEIESNKSKLNGKSIPMPSKQSSLYKLTEDEAIIEYVLKSNSLDVLKGNRIWMEAEGQICHGRTWQSMKERFAKRIMPNIGIYSITRKDSQRLKYFFYRIVKKRSTPVDRLPVPILKKKTTIS